MELPVFSKASKFIPLIEISLHGPDSGFGEVKQHKRTVKKLMMAVGREIEQTLVSLLSLPSRHLPQINTPWSTLLGGLLPPEPSIGGFNVACWGI